MGRAGRRGRAPAGREPGGATGHPKPGLRPLRRRSAVAQAPCDVRHVLDDPGLAPGVVVRRRPGPGPAASTPPGSPPPRGREVGEESGRRAVPGVVPVAVRHLGQVAGAGGRAAEDAPRRAAARGRAAGCRTPRGGWRSRRSTGRGGRGGRRAGSPPSGSPGPCAMPRAPGAGVRRRSGCRGPVTGSRWRSSHDSGPSALAGTAASASSANGASGQRRRAWSRTGGGVLRDPPGERAGRHARVGRRRPQRRDPAPYVRCEIPVRGRRVRTGRQDRPVQRSGHGVPPSPSPERGPPRRVAGRRGKGRPSAARTEPRLPSC